MAFMRPEIVPGSYLLSLGVSPEDLGIAPVPGKWYGRLSAPGYLDSTEWCEYDSAEEALEGLCKTFGLCETCHEEGCDCDCETDDDDDEVDRGSLEYIEPSAFGPKPCRRCGDPRCNGH